MKTIYFASYSNNDGDSKVLKASKSLVELQSYCIRRAQKIVNILGKDEYQYTRKRRGRRIDIWIHYKDDCDIVSVVESFEIQPVGVI